MLHDKLRFGMEVIMNIAIIGTGGVGGYFGGKLAHHCKETDNVYFIARGEHLARIRENGLIIKSGQAGEMVCRPTMATESIEELPMLDLCLICVKGFDLQKVLERLKDKITDTTEIIPLLNGLDIYDRVRKVITKGTVYPACVYIGTYIEKPGVISQNGGACKIIFGQDIQNEQMDGKRVRECFDHAGILYEWSGQVQEAIWNKFMCVAPYGLVTAAYNKTMREVYEDDNLSRMVLRIMEVVYQLAEKSGVNLEKDSVRIAYELAKDFPWETKTSFQRDYEKKRGCDERETFGGTILMLAEKYQIEVEDIRKLYEGLD